MLRSILAVDIEGSTQCTNPEKAELRRIMYSLIDQALRATGIGPEHLEPLADRGDGLLILVRPHDQVPKTRLLGCLIPNLAALLVEHNAKVVQPALQLRLRAVFHVGDVIEDGAGFYGESLDVAFRLLDSPAAKRALRDAPASPLALVVSGEIYSGIVMHGSLHPPTPVRAISVRVARERHRSWVYIPASEGSPWLSAAGASVDESSPAVPGIAPAWPEDYAEIPAEQHSVDGASEVEFAICYQTEMPYLVRYLQKCFHGACVDDATDAAQSAFVDLLPIWDTVRKPRAWLRRVVFRKMLEQTKDASFSGSMPSRLVSPPTSEWLEQREQEQAVMAALHTLPPAQRQVIALLYDQFTYAEIAEIMNISEPAVRKNIERARRRLKEILGLGPWREDSGGASRGQHE